jgi:NAD(P)-dependent dehydrogenase (short-subunit alcohol dehydrogenase family)
MSDRVVVVTGASAGVGRATAREFAERGDKVALVARGEEGLRAAATEVEALGATARMYPCDVTDHDALARVADAVERDLGAIDVWVNNAFATVFAPFLDIRPEEFRRVTDVTYHGYMHGTRIALERMLPRNRGVVVQVGSALAYRGIPLQSAYSGAKHAIQGFTEAVRCELLHQHSDVRVTMVQLPAVNTPQFDWALSRMRRKAMPVPPIYQPEVAARAIVHAAGHPNRRERYVGASTVLTILGDKVASGLLDRYLARTGYKSQQTGTPEDRGRPVNLWEPVDREPGDDQGAHGRFNDTAHPHAPTTSRPVLAGAATVAGAGLAWLVALWLRRSPSGTRRSW